MKRQEIQLDYTAYGSGYQLKLPMETEIFIPEDDPVRLLNAICERIDYEELYAAYSEEGRNEYSPTEHRVHRRDKNRGSGQPVYLCVEESRREKAFSPKHPFTAVRTVRAVPAKRNVSGKGPTKNRRKRGPSRYTSTKTSCARGRRWSGASPWRRAALVFVPFFENRSLLCPILLPHLHWGCPNTMFPSF